MSVERDGDATASPRVTTRPGSETTRLQVGDAVRVTRTTASTGSWKRYSGREGWVAAINRQRFPDGPTGAKRTYVELGVSWSVVTADNKRSADVWFRADELARR